MRETLIWAGGWAAVGSLHLADHPDHRAYVRFGAAPTGRLAIVDLRVIAPDGLDGEVVRRLALGRLESLANDPVNASWLRERIASSEDPDSVHPDLDPADPGAQMLFDGLVEELTRPLRKRELRLPVPDVGVSRKPDEFYRKVAAAYGRAAAHGKPAVLLAEANDVPVTTIHRWVKEARRRGLLAPGERRRRREQSP